MYHFHAPSAVKSITLAGTIELYIPTKDPASIVKASFATDAGEPLKNDVLKAAGVAITLQPSKAGNSNELSFTIDDPKGKVRDVEIVDAGGRILADRVSPAQVGGLPKLSYRHTINSMIGYDLRLMSWGDGSGVPKSGKKSVILGIDNNGRLHIRTFDADGKRMDTDETKFFQASQPLRSPTPEEVRQGAAIAALKPRIPGLLPPHLLTSAETTQLQRDLTPILGQTAKVPADAVAKIYVMTEKSVVTVPFELNIPIPQPQG
jgi:hypothetical protein